jgi:hypothetical protein
MDYTFNWKTLRELEKHTEAATVAGFCTFNSNIAVSRQTVSGSMMLVSGRYFSVIDVQPLVGRLIGPEDDVLTDSRRCNASGFSERRLAALRFR